MRNITIRDVEGFMRKRSILIIFIFIAFYFIARLPFLIEPLGREEGFHAFAFCCNPPAPKYLWVGIINGQDQFGPPQHPALIYETLGAFGTPWRALIDAARGGHPMRVTFILRLAFTLFQFIYFLLLLLLLANAKDIDWREWLMWLVVVLSIAPIAISISTSVQVDGSLGSLMVGLVTLSLLAYRYKLFSSKLIFALAFIASLFLGFGKNEWGLSLLLSLALTGILIFFARRFYQDYDGFVSDLTFLGTIAAGLIAGNLINYFFDSKNYVDGLRLMMALSGHKNTDFITMLVARVKLLYLHLLLIALVGAGVLLSFRKKLDAVLFFVFVWGGILFSAYFVTQAGGWQLQRYYAPSLVVLVAGVVLVSTYYSVSARRYVFAALVSISLVNSILFTGAQIGYFKDRLQVFIKMSKPSPQAQLSDACVPRMNDGEAFVTRRTDEFIISSMGEVEREQLVGQFGKSICK
jgi:hypothetical protein